MRRLLGMAMLGGAVAGVWYLWRRMTAPAASPEWQAIWAKHPNENGYLHMNARFMKASP